MSIDGPAACSWMPHECDNELASSGRWEGEKRDQHLEMQRNVSGQIGDYATCRLTACRIAG